LALDRFQDRSRHLLAQLVALTHAEILLSSLCINGEEFINGCNQCDRAPIVRMGFDRERRSNYMVERLGSRFPLRCSKSLAYRRRPVRPRIMETKMDRIENAAAGPSSLRI
jgi:hypothetical protein